MRKGQAKLLTYPNQPWNMAPLIPELARDDVRGVFDGELVAFETRVPHFPLVGSRLLHGR